MAFARYAQYYDLIYKRKDYERECLYLEKLFKKYHPAKVRTVLDLGCGTGNYMIPLIKSGYKVTGIDASGSMLRLAKEKLAESGLKAQIHKNRLQSFALGARFDAVLCLFSVIDYLTRLKDLSFMLDNVVAHMKKRSLFIFDFWNVSAVENYYSPRKKNVFKADGKIFERRSTTKIDPRTCLCEVHYTCSVKSGRRLIAVDQEMHKLRYFSVEEMIGYLKKAGLAPVHVHPFMNPKGKIKRNTWDVTIVAQKI